MELGLIRKIDIDREMQQSYLDYAMSVIVSRALPDARDGLKPVQRRILYAMYEMGLRADSQFRKSARIVGEVMGKYHPHGDAPVYESMARLAQDFSMRCMLVEGQGNFGSVDGDPPAAMRYTEARLTAIATEMLAQLHQNTVKFVDNFDGTLQEPEVLPAAIPNLLVNGASGIAVGMATNIPPHNLGEVTDALVYMLSEWEKLDDIDIATLMRYIKGPDFPTGGMILQDAETETLLAAYGTGRGKVVVQARAHMEEMVRGRNRIIVTELPYQVNKASLIERIAELVRDGAIEGIVDLRDESDRQGMRIVIELSKTAEPQAILRELYKRTPMQTTFGINLLALVDGEPRLLTLKQALRVYVEHRLEVIRRRSEFELEKARHRAHILEGLRVALKSLDEVISLIRNAPDADEAKIRLMKRFKLSEIQAQAILDMQLRRLASLERKKIELEYKETIDLIHRLEDLLASPKKIRQEAIRELLLIKEKYADKRRTQIVGLKKGQTAERMLTTTDMLPEQKVWVTIAEDGTIYRSGEEIQPRLWGKDAPLWIILTNSHHTLYLVTDQGRAAAIPVHAVPEGEKPSDGISVYKLSPLPEREPLAVAFALPARRTEEPPVFLLTATRGGILKKTIITELPGPSAQVFTLCKVNEGDLLAWAALTRGKDEIILVTARGMGIRFNEEDIRPMGLVAAGVNGIKLGVGDEVIGVQVVEGTGELLILANDGKGKRISIKDFPVQGRYGQGVILWKLTGSARLVGCSYGKPTRKVTLHMEKAASRLFRLDEAPVRTRVAAGVAAVEVKPGDSVLTLTSVWDALQFWEGDQAVKALERRTPKQNPSTQKPAVKAPSGAKTKKTAQKTSAAPEEKSQPVKKHTTNRATQPSLLVPESETTPQPPRTRTRNGKSEGKTPSVPKTKTSRSTPAGERGRQRPKKTTGQSSGGNSEV